MNRLARFFHPLRFCALVPVITMPVSAALTFQLSDTSPQRVEVSAENRVFFQSPTEGHWSAPT